MDHIIKLFIKNHNDVSNKKVRTQYGILSAVIGVVCNFVLFAGKFAIGTISNSIAITADAFNNLSDCGSNIVTVLSFKMSAKPADSDHPFGHGRIEYLASLLVTFLVCYVGFDLGRSSIIKLFENHAINFSIISVIILIFSIFVKLFVWYTNNYMSKKINSSILKATAIDSRNDIIMTSAVLISTIISGLVTLPFDLDAISGCVISVFIFISGYQLMKETITSLLGTTPNPELTKGIEESLLSYPKIVGIHDLVIHDYGPGNILVSAHVEVPDDVNIIEIHETIDLAERELAAKYDILITIHMDPISLNCDRTNTLKEMVADVLADIDSNITFHDFRVVDGENNVNLLFDICVPPKYSSSKREQLLKNIKDKLNKIDPIYTPVIIVDTNYS